jgi:squalene-hopene/tetraprenyl-beta-curcumene cyclase
MIHGMKIFVTMFFVCAAMAAAAELPSQSDVSMLQEVSRAQERGTAWLLKQQEADGSWRKHPAMTGLALTALARGGCAEKDAMDRAVKFILSNAKTNGAIFGGDEKDKHPNYSTAICAMALMATGRADVMDAVKRARVFLLNSQFGADEQVKEGDASYGGIGYGKRLRPDLSNTQWALEAIRLTESVETRAGDESPHQGSRLHWNRAVKFLERCQNLPSANDQPWAKNVRESDAGGFVYMPGLSFADEEPATDGKTPLRSYGSMSYAGLKSYIYAELKKDDPRVKAAVEWLQHNYSVDENPALGAQGLFYYLHTVAKALTVYGDDTFKDAKGRKHDWRYELMRKFVTLQKADGFWANENNRWWENDPVLCTSYSLIALEILQARRYP